MTSVGFSASKPSATTALMRREGVGNNEPTSKLIALQIKTGVSYFRPKDADFVFNDQLTPSIATNFLGNPRISA
jgi:hypothetical protein